MSQLQILRVKEVLSITSVCRATLYLWIKAGTFPAPLQLGPKRIGWTRVQIEQWISSRLPSSKAAK